MQIVMGDHQFQILIGRLVTLNAKTTEAGTEAKFQILIGRLVTGIGHLYHRPIPSFKSL